MINHDIHESTDSNRAAMVGALGAVLVGAGAIVGPSSDSPPITDVQDAATTYIDETGAVLTAAIIGLLGVAALLWFAGVIRAWVSSRTDPGSPLPGIAFGGTIGGAVSLAFSGVIVVSQALRARDATVDPNVLASLDDLATHLFGIAAPLCFSALVGAVAVIGLRGATEVGRPFAFASVPLVILMLVPPVAWIGMLLFLVWLLALSIIIATRHAKVLDHVSTNSEPLAV